MWDALPHTVQWRRRASGSEWDGDSHESAVQIPARVERRTRMRQTATGDERVNETRILVGREHAITENDTLDGERVEATDVQVDLSGETVGLICYVESSRGI